MVRGLHSDFITGFTTSYDHNGMETSGIRRLGKMVIDYGLLAVEDHLISIVLARRLEVRYDLQLIFLSNVTRRIP